MGRKSPEYWVAVVETRAYHIRGGEFETTAKKLCVWQLSCLLILNLLFAAISIRLRSTEINRKWNETKGYQENWPADELRLRLRRRKRCTQKSKWIMPYRPSRIRWKFKRSVAVLPWLNTELTESAWLLKKQNHNLEFRPWKNNNKRGFHWKSELALLWWGNKMNKSIVVRGWA